MGSSVVPTRGPLSPHAGLTNPLRAFTLIDFLTTVAGLVILLGVMVSLARHVRARSADTLTQHLLVRLDRELASRPQLIPDLATVPSIVASSSDVPDENALQLAARQNSLAFVKIWRNATADAVLRELPLSIYDGLTLRDAWGSPVVFVPLGKPSVGIAPQGRAFFMSAGPDRTFSTLLDNLYSYEYGTNPIPER